MGLCEKRAEEESLVQCIGINMQTWTVVAQVETEEIIAFIQKTLADNQAVRRVAISFPAMQAYDQTAAGIAGSSLVVIAGETNSCIIARGIGTGVEDDSLLARQHA